MLLRTNNSIKKINIDYVHKLYCIESIKVGMKNINKKYHYTYNIITY